MTAAPDLRVIHGGADPCEGALPPHDLGAERAVLGAALLDGGTVDQSGATLSADRFYSEAHRRTWEAIASLHVRGGHIDAQTVASELQATGRLAQAGGHAALADLLNAPPALSDRAIGAYVQRVQSTATLRDVLAAVSEARVAIYAGVDDSRAFLEGLEQRLFDLARAELAGGAVEHISAASRREAASIAAGKPLAYSTGYAHLDAILGGGLRPKGLSIVGGPTSMGKSALAMNVAVNVAGAVGVLVCSLEMTAEELVQRAACADAGVPIEWVRERQLSQGAGARYHNAHARLAGLPLYVADEPGQTIATVRAKGRRVASELARKGGRLGLVVVDYLQLLKPIPGPKSETREQQVAALSRNLKGIAKDLGVHVMALSQLNAGSEGRKAGDKRPRLGDLRESKAIANDADVVAFVHRDDYDAERDDRGGRAPVRGFADVIVAKHLGGRTGVARLIFDRPRCRFENVPPAGDDAPDTRGGS